MYQVVACSSTSCCNRVVFHGSVHNLGWLVVQKKEKHKRNMNDSVSVSSPPSLPFFFFFLLLTSLDGWSKVFFFFFSLLLQLFAPLLSPEKLDKISDPVWNWGEGAIGRHTRTDGQTSSRPWLRVHEITAAFGAAGKMQLRSLYLPWSSKIHRRRGAVELPLWFRTTNESIFWYYCSYRRMRPRWWYWSCPSCWLE